MESPVHIESFMPCETVYAYGTTIRVWYRKTYHTRMERTVRVRYVPYAYGMKYAYGTQQAYSSHYLTMQCTTLLYCSNYTALYVTRRSCGSRVRSHDY